MIFWKKICQFGFEILVFIVLAVIGITLNVVFSSNKIKTWQKTTVFLVLAEVLAAVIGWLSWSNGSAALCVLSAILAVCFLIGGIYGHRKNWKQTSE